MQNISHFLASIRTPSVTLPVGVSAWKYIYVFGDWVGQRHFQHGHNPHFEASQLLCEKEALLAKVARHQTHLSSGKEIQTCMCHVLNLLQMP